LEARTNLSSKGYSVTDGLLIDLSREPYRFWIIEYELKKHSLDRHVIPQIRKFYRDLQTEKSLRHLQHILFEVVVEMS
jgi:hypothetical protein